MFDCPEPTHTSPTRTSSIVIVFEPETVSLSGPPAVRGSSLTLHLPSWSAVAVFSWERNLTVTFSSGAALPQTGTARSRWRTMWSENRGGNWTAARALPARPSAATTAHASRRVMRVLLDQLRARVKRYTPKRNSHKKHKESQKVERNEVRKGRCPARTGTSLPDPLFHFFSSFCALLCFLWLFLFPAQSLARARGWSDWSRDDVLDDVTAHVGQAVVASLETVGELLV